MDRMKASKGFVNGVYKEWITGYYIISIDLGDKQSFNYLIKK